MNSLFRPKSIITNCITADLTCIERARGFQEEVALSENWVLEMSNRALVLEVHHTAHMESMRLRFTVTLAEQITVQKATEQVTE